MTISAGVASYPHHAGTAESLLEQADRALYAAKERGRNRVVLANDLGCSPPDDHISHLIKEAMELYRQRSAGKPPGLPPPPVAEP